MAWAKQFHKFCSLNIVACFFGVLMVKQYSYLLQKGPAFPRSPIGSVSFQADTDNRRNFPSDKSFHLFKRQRYDILEISF